VSTTPTAAAPTTDGRPPAPPPTQSRSTQELRAEVEQARARLASTVGELGGAIDDTRNRIVRRAKTAAPIVAGAVGAFVAYKVLRRVRS
jgi:hypothetical protein